MAAKTTTRGQRRPRLSEAETERRMFETAIAQVLNEGLAVGIDSLGFETLIEAAEVSRSTVYRRWPSKEDFYSELLVQLAGNEQHGLRSFAATVLPVLLELLPNDQSWRTSPQTRRATLVELGRTSGQANFNHAPTRVQVRTLMAMIALKESDIRLHAEIGSALSRSEEAFRELLSPLYGALGQVLGFRPLPGVEWSAVATMGSAALIGLIVQDLRRSVGPVTFTGDPFETGMVREWTAPAVAYTSMVMTLLEPDPDFDASQADAILDRIAASCEALNPSS